MQLTTIEVPGRDALAVLNQRRALFPTTGEYPFLIGEPENRDRLFEGFEFNPQDTADIIRASFDVDLNNWLQNKRQELEEFELTDDEIIGDWPAETIGEPSLTLHLDIGTDNLLPVVVIGLAKIETPWHLPAFLKYGGWNDCPDAEVQCAIHRDWQTCFGAEIAGVSGDILECIVANPPRDEEHAMNLAWEQYLYCQDIVVQGCETISNLAATLLNSPCWYFWWD